MMHAMLKSSEPIFAVADIVRSVRFYVDVLGFEREWLYGTPPVHAGVAMDKFQLMFSLRPALAEQCAGHEHFFRVDDVKAMFERHKTAGAPMVEELVNKPWGMSEYKVRDPDGYHLRFAGAEIYERPASAAESLPPHIRIDLAAPTHEDARRLFRSVNWEDDPRVEAAIPRSVFSVTAADTRNEKIVGMVRVVGDGKAFTLWDVVVDKDYQGQRIGSAMLERAIAELKKIARPGTFIGLFTHKPAFYERHGFQLRGGMSRPL